MTLTKERLARIEEIKQTAIENALKESRHLAAAEKVKKPRGRKKGFKEPLKPALPVKTLWLTATPEQKKRAHQIGVLMMEYWMGRITKEEVGEVLETSPLRVWQLSQQAISGMLAGLLVQPKTRAKGVKMNRDEDPKYLQKKIAELEKVIQMQDRLIAVMREMPGCKDVAVMPSKTPKLQGVKSRAKRKTKIQPGAHHEGGTVVDGGEGSGSP